MTKTPRKHKPTWADNTRKTRNANAIIRDNELAQAISFGKYPTLRRLISAAQRGEIVLVMKSPKGI